nr:hypothetical protein [Tanacetum cinerariifolium]
MLSNRLTRGRIWLGIILMGLMKGSRVRSPAAAANNQRALGAIQKIVTCYKCGKQGHYKSGCLKLKNQNRGNQSGNSEAHVRVYALGGGGAILDSNVITGKLSRVYMRIITGCVPDTTSGDAGTKSGRTVTLTAEDMQKKKNDVKARTTLLLYLPEEHQLRFNKYKTARELWAVILKTFDGNEATKKTKKNLLKQQYRNFKAEGSETLEQTFTRLQLIIEVQKKSKPNSQNMAFISLAKHSSRNEDGNTACVPTASTNVPTASASVATISQDTACAYITSQSSGSQIKFKNINQIDEDDMEEMDIKWNMALLSMRATKKTKKNLLKQQYGNFRAEGSKTLEQTFTRLQVIVGQLQFMDVEVEQDDLNQKFLTSLAPEWLMHTIVWRNRSDLDTMSLDDLYNHLKSSQKPRQRKERQLQTGV